MVKQKKCFKIVKIVAYINCWKWKSHREGNIQGPPISTTQGN